LIFTEIKLLAKLLRQSGSYVSNSNRNAKTWGLLKSYLNYFLVTPSSTKLTQPSVRWRREIYAVMEHNKEDIQRQCIKGSRFSWCFIRDDSRSFFKV